MDFVSHVILAHFMTGTLIFSKELTFGSLFPDLDKVYVYAKRKFRRAESRTWFHELPFLSLVVLIASLTHHHLFACGVITHIFLDFVTGETRPFYPFIEKKVDYNLSLKIKAVMSVMVWASGLATIKF